MKPIIAALASIVLVACARAPAVQQQPATLAQALAMRGNVSGAETVERFNATAYPQEERQRITSERRERLTLAVACHDDAAKRFARSSDEPAKVVAEAAFEKCYGLFAAVAHTEEQMKWRTPSPVFASVMAEWRVVMAQGTIAKIIEWRSTKPEVPAQKPVSRQRSRGLLDA